MDFIYYINCIHTLLRELYAVFGNLIIVFLPWSSFHPLLSVRGGSPLWIALTFSWGTPLARKIYLIWCLLPWWPATPKKIPGLLIKILQMGCKCHQFQFKYSWGYAFVPRNGFHAKCPCYIKFPHIFKTYGGAPPHRLNPRSNTGVCSLVISKACLKSPFFLTQDLNLVASLWLLPGRVY